MAFRPIVAVPHPGFTAGRYYTAIRGTVSTNVLLVENTIYYDPIYIPMAASFDRLSFTIATGAGAAENEVRTGIYRTATNGQPGARLVDNGRTVIGTSTGAIDITISQRLAPGWYWLAIIPNRATGSATQPTVRGAANDASRQPSIYWLGLTAPDLSGGGNVSWRNAETVADWTTYTLPATATVTQSTGAAVPALWLRAA